MSEGPDYDGAKREQWARNVEEARDKPASRRGAVESFAQRLGLHPELVWHSLCTDDAAAPHFAKDPGKQSLHEKAAALWVAALPGISNFDNLPSDGPVAQYILGGRVVSGEAMVSADTPKSVDFRWEISLDGLPVLTYYASHKFTQDDGGAQENQFRDLLAFAKEASQLRIDNGTRVLCLADGPFYARARRRSGVCRMKELQEAMAPSAFSRALPCSDLPALLANDIERHIAGSGRDNPHATKIAAALRSV